MSVEKIEKDGELLATIIRSTFAPTGVHFFTPQHFGLQTAVQLRHPHQPVPAHKHVPFKNITNLDVQEVFFIYEGKVRVRLFDKNHSEIKDTVLEKGDLAILNTGHAMDFLEPTKFLEIKQGPYRGVAEEKVFLK